MPGMSDFILRAPVFKRLGDQSRVAGFHKTSMLANILDDLKNSSKTLLEIAFSAAMYTDAKQAEHLDKDWLDSAGSGFWHTSNYKVAELVRGGIVKALEVYQSSGKPLDFFWMISGKNMTDPWNVLVAECAEHILVIFFTPNVPCNLPMVDDYSMFIIEQDKVTKNVITRHTKRPVG
jgi:hypothetical protein